ncbi:tRNA-dihydrouridine synthase C [Obesumbacterium proteus ATCC 12841]|uniref:tRNA-dihydrouridine synthase C n=1 Tax=Obesumbacterium proteus ATCC 12841 TaxID=1354268 RepID=A0AA91INW2_9GAMM|nr:tRNA-dihydrouridine synthase C [Obesumbacterium proteus ATCC 12841]
MEGVLDSLVRELLTEVNDYDLCITEFVRVVDSLLPEKVYYRLCPELANQSLTPSGTAVRVQLLGQHPQWLGENAARAVELGSWGVDLNCGWTKFMRDQLSTMASSNNLNWIITAN